jgi:hypothetical protein
MCHDSNDPTDPIRKPSGSLHAGDTPTSASEKFVKSTDPRKQRDCHWLKSTSEKLAAQYRTAVVDVIRYGSDHPLDALTALARRLTLSFGDFQICGLAPVWWLPTVLRTDGKLMTTLRDNETIGQIGRYRWARFYVPGILPLSTIGDAKRALADIADLHTSDGQPTPRLRAMNTVLRNRGRQAGSGAGDENVGIIDLLAANRRGTDYKFVAVAKKDAERMAREKGHPESAMDRGYKAASAARDLCRCLAGAGWIPPLGTADPPYRPWVTAPEFAVWYDQLAAYMKGLGNQYPTRFGRRDGPLEYLLGQAYAAKPPQDPSRWKAADTSHEVWRKVITRVEEAFTRGEIDRERRRETRRVYTLLRDMGEIDGPEWLAEHVFRTGWTEELSRRAAKDDWEAIGELYPNIVDGPLGLKRLVISLAGSGDLRQSIGLPAGRTKQLHGERERAVTHRSRQTMGRKTLVRYIDLIGRITAFAVKSEMYEKATVDLSILGDWSLISAFLDQQSYMAKSTLREFILRIGVITSPHGVNLAMINPDGDEKSRIKLAEAFQDVSGRLVSDEGSKFDEMKPKSTENSERSSATANLEWLGDGNVHEAYPNLLRGRVALARRILKHSKCKTISELLSLVRDGDLDLTTALAEDIQRLAVLQLLSLSAMRDEELRRLRLDDLNLNATALKIVIPEVVHKMRKRHALPRIGVVTKLDYRSMSLSNILGEKALARYDADVHDLYVKFVRLFLLTDGTSTYASDFFLVPNATRARILETDPVRSMRPRTATDDGLEVIGGGVWSSGKQYYAIALGMVSAFADLLGLEGRPGSKILYFPRRVFATFLCFKEKQLFAKKLLGHADLATTLTYYDGLLAEDHDTSELLDDIM